MKEKLSIDTAGLPPYNEQKTKKIKAKPIYVAPMNIIKEMKAKENKNLKGGKK
jgi:hypothetical protein